MVEAIKKKIATLLPELEQSLMVPGDEVIVPAYTYTASASVVEHVGAKIVFIDCAKNSYEMDYTRNMYFARWI